MVALVTGGAGFIGSHLVNQLLLAGHSVRVLDDFSSGRPENLARLPVELHQCSITEAEAVRAAVRGVEVVFHLAALVSVPASFADPATCMRVNAAATFDLARMAKDAGARRFVFASSSAIYGAAGPGPISEESPPQPQSPYAESKWQAEEKLKDLNEPGFQLVAFRFFNVYGPRQRADSPYSGVISRFSRQLIQGEPLTLHGDGQQTRDFVYVADVVAALLAEPQLPVPGPLNVGSGTAVSILDLVKHLEQLAGRKAEIRHGPDRPGDVRHSRADIGRIRQVLGWQPQVTLSDGLSRMLGATG